MTAPSTSHQDADTEPAPTHYVAATIMDDHNRALGNSVMDTVITREPTRFSEVEELGRDLTDSAHRRGTLPRHQRYSILSWTAYATREA